jgi:hypothetical protein
MEAGVQGKWRIGEMRTVRMMVTKEKQISWRRLCFKTLRFSQPFLTTDLFKVLFFREI